MPHLRALGLRDEKGHLWTLVFRSPRGHDTRIMIVQPIPQNLQNKLKACGLFFPQEFHMI